MWVIINAMQVKNKKQIVLIPTQEAYQSVNYPTRSDMNKAAYVGGPHKLKTVDPYLHPHHIQK